MPAGKKNCVNFIFTSLNLHVLSISLVRKKGVTTQETLFVNFVHE